MRALVLIPVVGVVFLVQSLWAMSLPNYIESYLKQSETLQVQNSKSKQARQNLVIQSDHYQLGVSLSPQLKTTNYSYYSQSQNQKLFSTSLVQKTGFGGEFKLSLLNDLGSEYPDLSSYTDSSYSFSWSQSLWNNGFGRLSWVSRSKAQAELKKAELAERQVYQQTCEGGVQIYINGYLQQEKARVFKKSFSDAEKAFNIVKGLRRRRLINKIDYLSAQNDTLKSEELFLKQQAVHKKSIVELLVPLGGSLELEDLQNPEIHFNQDINKKPVVESIEYRLAQLGLDISSKNLIRVRESDKDPIYLTFAAGRNQGKYYSSPNQIDSHEDYSGVSLTWETDLFKESRKAQIAQASLEKTISDLELSKSLKSVNEKLQKLSILMDELKQRIELSSRRIELLKNQSEEAFRLMRAGKLEFIDYLNYRDQYRNESINLLELENQFWEAQVSYKMMFLEEKCLG